MRIVARFPAVLALVLTLASAMAFTPPASAQRRPAPPEIENFSVTPEDLAPGVELTFTVQGTPRARASVRIGGINKVIALREVSQGVYEGMYTVRRADRAIAGTPIRATLTARGQSASDTIRMAWRSGPPPRAADPLPPVAAPVIQPGGPAITSFNVVPLGKIEPGADLRFTLSGTPGGAASFSIDGVARDVVMQEVRPGQYEGSYTIRRLDNFPATVNITAALTAGGRSVRSALKQPLIADAKPPVIRNLSPRDGEIVPSGNPISLAATFDDSGGVGVDPKSVRVKLGGRDITRNSAITPQYFNFNTDLPPGTYPVELTASDFAGNAVIQTWRFTVVPLAAVPTTLPLQIVSPLNNAEIGGGSTEVRGRTAPDANVEVQVQAIASIAGLFGITQPVLTKSLKADAAGNFAFSFQPQIPVPGSRYELTIRASKAELSKDIKVVLFQKK